MSKKAKKHQNNGPVDNRKKSNKIILPRNISQENYIDALDNHNINIVIATGAAGSGKTMLATILGLMKLQRNEYQKIIITRPAVSVDESHGYLPGDIFEKMTPWMLPIMDYFIDYGCSKEEIQRMIKLGTLEIAPLAYMRGRNFSNAWIIADECQNTTAEQFKMLMTRINEKSKLIITGDLKQHDRGFESNGLHDFLKRYNNEPGFSIVHFRTEDVQRLPIVKTVLKMYGDE